MWWWWYLPWLLLGISCFWFLFILFSFWRIFLVGNGNDDNDGDGSNSYLFFLPWSYYLVLGWIQWWWWWRWGQFSPSAFIFLSMVNIYISCYLTFFFFYLIVYGNSDDDGYRDFSINVSLNYTFFYCTGYTNLSFFHCASLI